MKRKKKKQAKTFDEADQVVAYKLFVQLAFILIPFQSLSRVVVVFSYLVGNFTVGFIHFFTEQMTKFICLL